MQSPIINVMSAAAIKASKGLLRDFSEVDKLQVSKKGTANFVTSADLRTERTLQRELSAARPDYGFLMEESGEVAGKDPAHRWIIDPLDGTSNFIHAIPYFCISIALEKRETNGNSHIIAGVVYDPIHNEMFTAEQYKGAFLNSRRLTVSTRDNLGDAMCVAGNPRHATKEAQAQLDNVVQQGATVRYFGACALDLANLAAGRLDACWYYTIQPWDVAASLLLIQEAGGIVTDFSGQPANAYTPALLASNKALGPSLQKLILKAA